MPTATSHGTLSFWRTHDPVLWTMNLDLRPWTGKPEQRPLRNVPLAERLAIYIDWPGNDTECWPFMGQIASNGYGRIKVKCRTRGTHCVMWELFNGSSPPAGVVVGHVCHDRAVAAGTCPGGEACAHRRCVNPTHLTLTTQRDNVLLGNSSMARKARQTHCVNGHALTPENVYRPPSRPNGRTCRECKRVWDREHYAAKHGRC